MRVLLCFRRNCSLPPHLVHNRYNAELRGKKGVAPNTHFTFDSSTPTAKGPGKTATATMDFTGRDADELTFKAGQKIIIHDELKAEPGW